MSGPLTVPFTIAALFPQRTIQKALFGTLAICCAVSASYLLWKRERVTVIRLRERITPKFEIIFDPNCPSCVWEPEPGVRWIRIGLRNMGIESIDAVVVSLAELRPNPAQVLQLPTALRVKDDRSEDGQPIILHPSEDEHVHIDVVAQRWDRDGMFQINFAPRGVPSHILPGSYVGTIVAQGRDVPPCRRQFILEPQHHGPFQGHPTLRLLGPDEPAPAFPEPEVRQFRDQIRDFQDRNRDLWN